jgi:hypothetical protein
MERVVTGENTVVLHPASDVNPAGKIELGFTGADSEACLAVFAAPKPPRCYGRRVNRLWAVCFRTVLPREFKGVSHLKHRFRWYQHLALASVSHRV